MIELVLGFAVLVVVGGLAWLIVARPDVVRRNRGARLQSHHLWAVAQANTTDGVTARLSVDFVAVGDPDLDVNSAIDAVEESLRQQIATSAAHQLLSIGDMLTGPGEDTPTWTNIERAVVASSEIEVTPEFRRLINAAD